MTNVSGLEDFVTESKIPGALGIPVVEGRIWRCTAIPNVPPQHFGIRVRDQVPKMVKWNYNILNMVSFTLKDRLAC
jgi:hypothetical protein